MPFIRTVLLLAAAAVSLAAPARASGEEAWDEVRTAVEAACRAAAAAALDDVAARVDPFGSERFGLALLSGIEKGTRDARSVICAYDKRTKTAEIGTLLDLADAGGASADFPAGIETAPADTAATLIYPGSANCGQDCLAHWTVLSSEDQAQLAALPEQVRRTLAEAKPGADEAAPVAAARRAGEAVIAAAAGRPDGTTAPDLSAVAPGERTCSLYWFGFLDEGSSRVGTHRCTVAKLADGGLALSKTSGDRLTVLVQMLGEGLAVAGGRSGPGSGGAPTGGYDLTRPVDPVNPNYGNKVGLAVPARDGRLYVVSIDERGMEPKDSSFFEVLAVDLPGAK